MDSKPELKQGTFVNLKQLSKKYGIKLNTLRQWASERRFPLYKPTEAMIIVDLEEFDLWFQGKRIESAYVPRDRRKKNNVSTLEIKNSK